MAKRIRVEQRSNGTAENAFSLMEAPVIEEDMVALIVVLEKFHQGLSTLFGCPWVKSSAI